jgi:branched-chain amino acid transport system substrate-binding protein
MRHIRRLLPVRRLLPALVPVLLITSGWSTESALAQGCEVKIGVAGPMSGGAAAFGLNEKLGADFQAALANEQGGLPVGDKKCKVTVVGFDSLYTSAGGAAAGNYFASEGIHVILGPVGSPEVTGFKPIGKRNGLVSLNMTYAKDAIGPDYPLAFHQLQAPPTWGPILIRRAIELFKFKSVVLLGPNDQGGTDGTKALAALYKDAGVKTTEEYYQRGTTNFAPIATRVMNANPDAVELSTMPPGDQTILVKQLLEAGFEGVIGSLGGGGEKSLLDGAGSAENLRNAYWLNIVALENPNVPTLKADFERVMKMEAPTFPHFFVAQTAAEQVLKAISAAGTDKDGEKIAQALRSLTPESRYFGKGGWRGKTQYGINQELAFPVGLGIYQNGKRVGVETVPIPSE